MEKIRCCIVQDLLPLYVDGVLGEETAQAVKDHLNVCESCRKDYETIAQNLLLPSAPDIQEESGRVLKGFKRHLRIKRTIAVVVAVAITAIVVISAFMVYINVGEVHDFFTEDTVVTIRDGQTDGKWEPLAVGESGYLNFDRIFCEKEITVDAGSDSAVTLRLRDTVGNIVIGSLTVQPGTGASLDELQRKTDYKVEMQTDANYLCIRFH